MKFSKKFLIFVFFTFFFQDFLAQSGFKNPGYDGRIGEIFSNSIIIAGGVNYYFGDVERMGIFSKYFHNQMSWYGQIGYTRNIFTEHFKIKAVVLIGALRGERESYSFKSRIIEPDLIFEYFPFIKRSNKCGCLDKIIGLYIYGGVGAAFSNIALDAIKTYNKVFDKNTISPICAFGIGYREFIAANWQLGFELGYRFVLGVDAINFNLDGYPIVPENKKWSKWRDGYYTFGITAAYNF
jgi:hypothetical protein